MRAGRAGSSAVPDGPDRVGGPLAAVELRVGLLFAITAVALPAPVFAVWGGLVPPVERRFEAGLSVVHALTAFSFAGVIYCLYDVGWLLRRWKAVAAAVCVTTAANLATGAVEQHPFHMIAMKYLSTTGLHYYATATSGVMLGFGVAFVLLLAVRLGPSRRPGGPLRLRGDGGAARGLDQDRPHVRRPLHHRVHAAAPALGAERAPDTYGKALRLAVGCIGGALSLLAYLSLLDPLMRMLRRLLGSE